MTARDAGLRADRAPRKAVTDITAEEAPPPVLPRGRVSLATSQGGVAWVDVEVAATPDHRTRGMMWRTQLPPGQGMLFIFAQSEEHAFWMRNTLIPLDMIFIDINLRVVGIVENATPHSTESRSVFKASRYVLEVPGGWSRSQKIVPGAAVELHVSSMIPVVP